MDQDKETKPTTKNGKQKNRFLSVCLIAVGVTFLAVIIVMVGYYAVANKYKLSYTSITQGTNYTYVYVSVDIGMSSSVGFSASDFSVAVNGEPVAAYGLKESSSSSSKSHLTVDKDQTIIIYFNFSASMFDSPYTFYYKGKILSLGKAVTFKTTS